MITPERIDALHHAAANAIAAYHGPETSLRISAGEQLDLCEMARLNSIRERVAGVNATEFQRLVDILMATTLLRDWLAGGYSLEDYDAFIEAYGGDA